MFLILQKEEKTTTLTFNRSFFYGVSTQSFFYATPGLFFLMQDIPANKKGELCLCFYPLVVLFGN